MNEELSLSPLTGSIRGCASNVQRPQNDETQRNNLHFTRSPDFHRPSLGGVDIISGKAPSDFLFSQNSTKN